MISFVIFHKWNTKIKVFHKNQKKLESDAIIIDQENLSIVICVIPQGQLDCHRRWIEKGKWDTFFPRTLKNSMHPWVYSTRYAGRGKLAGDKIIPLAPLQIKEQSSWNSSLWEEREISHISYSLPPLPSFMRLMARHTWPSIYMMHQKLMKMRETFQKEDSKSRNWGEGEGKRYQTGYVCFLEIVSLNVEER